MKILDCRNMACPVPVVTVKRALETAEGEQMQVMVDAGAACENVSRFAHNRGYLVEKEALEGGFVLTISAADPLRQPPTALSPGTPAVMLFGSDRMGDGPDDLGRLLMKNFIITLLDLDQLPDRMLFINSGVLLTTEGSEVLEALDKLGNRGVEVLSCGVCLDFFHRKDKLRAGMVTNMFTIAESLMGGRVMRL